MNSTRQDAHAGGHSAVHGAPGGLTVSTAGYTLQVSPKTFEAGQEEAFGLRILDRGGHAVRDFDEQHGERMHLIVVRRDLAHYQHLHPSLGTDGTWSVPLVLPEPGVYRAFADFSVGGESLTLGAACTCREKWKWCRFPILRASRAPTVTRLCWTLGL